MATPPTILYEPIRASEYLVSEANGSLSSEVAVITGGVDLTPGTVLGKLTTTGAMKLLNPAATDGTQTAAAILKHFAQASAGDVPMSITARLAEVNGLVLTWPAGITVAQQATAMQQLAALFIVVRT